MGNNGLPISLAIIIAAAIIGACFIVGIIIMAFLGAI
jgi:hypothetical protein